MTLPLAFPPGFVFGAATSAFQVDGNLENDWTEWERQGRLTDPQARNGRACGHWERFEEDLKLLKALGVSSYRWSLEWSRLEPRAGEFDDAAWAGTRARLEAVRAAGLKPTVTLHHFTHPVWFHAECPWHEPVSLKAWRRFVTRAAELLDGLDAAVVTINEPNVLVMAGYLGGAFPPGVAEPRLAFQAMANLMRAHAIVREVFQGRPGTRGIPLGISTNMVAFAPERRWHPLDLALTPLIDALYNHAGFEALTRGELVVNVPGLANARAPIEGGRRSMDFLGVNYYSRAHLRFTTGKPYLQYSYRDPHRRGLTDLGWEYYPEGFGQVLRQLKRYDLPVWVTENGLDDRTGARRSRFLYDHWRELLGAVADGVPVSHYFHWALMDNFEWLEAWGPRFGLYQVDFDTLERRPGPACAYFHQVASTGRLVPPTADPA